MNKSDIRHDQSGRAGALGSNMKVLGPFIFTFLSLTLSAQTFPVPVQIFDSLTFEVRRGRVCDTLARLQATDINALTAQLNAQGRIVSLQKAEIAAQAYALGIQIKQLQLSNAEATERQGRLRERLKRSRSWVIGEGAAIGLLVVILVL